jgi:hypothetical protein
LPGQQRMAAHGNTKACKDSQGCDLRSVGPHELKVPCLKTHRKQSR